jgi:uncharacterized membrane protein
MESALKTFSLDAALFVEAAAVIIATYGAAAALITLARLVVTGPTHGARKDTWRSFGTWLLLALEFELAADIIRSVIAPSWEEIGELAAIAVIRTFLNYFLERDLDHAQEPAP